MSLLYENNSPIIVSGMHRSGTSLLSKKLSEMNVFMGKYQDSNNESLFFQRLNRWMMNHMKCSWDNPNSFSNLNFTDTKYIKNHVSSMMASKKFNFIYFGFYKKIILSHTFSTINYPWGWKDPSNTFTLPIWKMFYPKCKVIYVLRHPADVALSLLKRNENIKSGHYYSKKSLIASKYLSLLSFSHSEKSYSDKLNDLNDCINLYNIYYNEINKYKDGNILFVKFEELLKNPKKIFKNICDFTNIDYNKINIDVLCKDIKSERAYAYLKLNLDSKSKSIVESKITKHIYNEQ